MIKQKEGNEPVFMRYLVEDKVCRCLLSSSCCFLILLRLPQLHDTQSYVDYLCVVHREIQMTLS